MLRNDALSRAARLWPLVLIAGLLLVAGPALAHDVSEADRAAVQGIEGPAFVPFLYLGAQPFVG